MSPKLICTLLLLVITQHVFAQNNETVTKKDEKVAKKKEKDPKMKEKVVKKKEKSISIDPRQYLTITETNTQTNKVRAIYEGESTNSQPIRVLDINSIIEIEFNQAAIADNIHFVGNISLLATLGHRNIEVSPYSKVGETQKSYGIQVKSAADIISNFHSLMIQVNKLTRNVEKKVSDDYSIGNKVLFTHLSLLIEFYSKLPPDSFTPIVEPKYDNIYNSLFASLEYIVEPSSIISILNTPDLYNNKDVLDILEALEKVEKYNNIDDVVYSNSSEEIESAIQYLKYFRLSGQQTELALLKSLNLNKVFLENLNTKLTRASAELISILSDTLTSTDTTSVNQKLVDLKSPLNQLLDAYKRFYAEVYRDMNEEDKSKVLGGGTLKFDDSGQGGLRDMLDAMAKKIGRMLYNQLFNATIDLKGAGAKQGEELKLFILFGDTDADSTASPLKLLIGSYEIDEIGWRMKISDSFLLIQRDKEPSGDSTLSPSNFKGAPGASMMWSYGNTRHTNWNKHKWVQRSFNWLEPSIGINVSYVDFQTDKDVEIGVGVIGGLFRNRLLFTAGYNFNAVRDQVYYGVGFSFLNLAGKLGEK